MKSSCKKGAEWLRAILWMVTRKNLITTCSSAFVTESTDREEMKNEKVSQFLGAYIFRTVPTEPFGLQACKEKNI